jgi:hypothetical protein
VFATRYARCRRASQLDRTLNLFSVGGQSCVGKVKWRGTNACTTSTLAESERGGGERERRPLTPVNLRTCGCLRLITRRGKRDGRAWPRRGVCVCAGGEGVRVEWGGVGWSGVTACECTCGFDVFTAPLTQQRPSPSAAQRLMAPPSVHELERGTQRESEPRLG